MGWVNPSKLYLNFFATGFIGLDQSGQRHCTECTEPAWPSTLRSYVFSEPRWLGCRHTITRTLGQQLEWLIWVISSCGQYKMDRVLIILYHTIHVRLGSFVPPLFQGYFFLVNYSHILSIKKIFIISIDLMENSLQDNS